MVLPQRLDAWQQLNICNWNVFHHFQDKNLRESYKYGLSIFSSIDCFTFAHVPGILLTGTST